MLFSASLLVSTEEKSSTNITT